MDLSRIKKLNEEMRTLLHEISPELRQKVVDTRKANYLAAQATADRLKAKYDRTSNLANTSRKIKEPTLRKAVEGLVDSLESTSSNIFGKNIKDSIVYTYNGCYILPNNDFFEGGDKLVPSAEEQLKHLLEEMSKKYRVKYFYKVDGYIVEIYTEDYNDKDEQEFPKGSFAEWYGKDLTGQTYKGNLDCHNMDLTSLYGCPKIVDGYFDCNNNNLTNLKGCPEIVKGIFDCSDNNLTSLKGCPKIVDGSFYCMFNNLESLEGCPKQVRNNFNCNNNNLTSLEGAPEIVGGTFGCDGNNLTSLKGAPEEVKGNFYCDDYLKEEAEQMGYNVR